MSNIRNVTFSALMNSVNGLTSNASTLKYAIFRSRMKIEDLNPSSISDYLNKLNSYLTFWEEISDDLNTAMKTAEGHENVYAISYESIKDVINFHNDYAAVLPFADGIIKGVTSARMTDPDDIEDFAMHTVKKAFNGSSCEPASYLDDIRRLIDRAGRSKASSLDAKMFNAVAKQRLFNSSDIRELSRAAQKTIDFLVHNLDSMAFKTNFTFEASGIKLFAAAINRIVDFITYSATVYAARIYVICEYASPYIRGDETAYESSGNEDDMSIDSPDASEVTVLRDADDFILRNPENTKDLNEILDIFISRIGAPDQSGVNRYAVPKQDNSIVKALIQNDLHKFLTNTPIGSDLEMSLLEELVIDPRHPMNQGKTSSKNEFLYIIRGMNLEPTVKSCRDMAVDLRNYAIMVTDRIYHRITCLSDNFTTQTFQNHDIKLADIKQNSECAKMYIDLYHDIVSCLLQKGRDIENKYNQLNKTETSRLLSQFSLKLPGEDERNTNHTMMTAVPDTTRTPMTLVEAYALPMFEEMQMYDSYLRTLPEFYDNEYLSEALDLSAIWNKLMSLIAAIGKRFRTFINDAKTTQALDWVSKNERLLLAMTFPRPAQMSDITPFKDKIGKPQGFDNLANGLRRFTIKDVETPEALEKFTKSLYPSEQVYNFWETKSTGSQTADNNTKAKNNMDAGSAKYRNWILFTDNVASVTTDDPAHVTLTDNELRKELAGWVATIKSVGGALKDAQSIDKDLQDAVRSIKQKLNSEPAPSTNNQPAQPSTQNSSNTANGSTQSQNSPGKKGEGDISANQSTSSGSGSGTGGDLRNVLLTNIITAQSRIYEGLINALIEYIRTTYAMIQRAYGLGKKPE